MSSVEFFLQSLHDLARYCNFGPNENENIRDRLIAGMLDIELAHKLQVEQDDLSLEKAADTARHWELMKSQSTSPIGYTVDAAAWGGTSKQPPQERQM